MFQATGSKIETLDISEGSRQSTVYKVLAKSTKSSTLSIIHYGIEAGDNDGAFEINPFSGILMTTDRIDRERKSDYILWLSATDSDTPSLSTYMSIRIRLTDENDNAPEFHQV